MRLVIDSEFAPSSSVGGGFRAPVERNGVVQLDVQLERQLLDNWCWAAIGSALGRYYGMVNDSQAGIASRVLETDCSAHAHSEAIRRKADIISRLDRALRVVGCYSHWTAGKPLFDRVRFEVNCGRPFGARIGWHAGAAHYILIHGYREEGERVLVADPLHGPGEYSLDKFPACYRDGGAWTETFWTRCHASATTVRETTEGTVSKL